MERIEGGESSTLAAVKLDVKKPLHLQIEADGDDYRFNYSYDGESFENLGGTVSGDILSTNVAGGFIGNFIGLYATRGSDVKVTE